MLQDNGIPSGRKRKIAELSSYDTLKLVRTLLSYPVLGISTAAIFLFFQMIILSMYLYTSDGRRAWFHLYGTSRPARSASKATKYKMKNPCQQWDSNPQPWDSKSDALPTKLAGLVESCQFKFQISNPPLGFNF